jgi:Flp pilus assembly CpaF family ATPase
MNTPNLYSRNPVIDAEVNRLLPLGAWLRDPNAKEISLNNGRAYIDCGGPGAMRDIGVIIPATAMRTAIRLLVATNGGYLDPAAPFANLTLACGARFHGALAPVADEPQISIRLHASMGRPITDFMTAPQVHLIADAIAVRKTVIIGGPTSAGKSTLLNAILDLLPLDLRLTIIEDISELQPSPGRNIVRRMTTGRADLKAQVFQALRARPDWIVIGETRDCSAWDLMDASRTGHPTLSTVHASSAQGILTRLMSLAGCDQQFVNEAIDLALFVQRLPDGQRKVTQILAKQSDGSWVSQ